MEKMKTYKKILFEMQSKYVKKDGIHTAKISSSDDAQRYIRQVWPLDLSYREAFVCLFLNRAGNTTGYHVTSIGGVNGTVADPKVVFKEALMAKCSKIILFHNHPSGTLEASEGDKKITKKLKAAGEILDIPVLDHIILTEEGYFSFADEGQL